MCLLDLFQWVGERVGSCCNYIYFFGGIAVGRLKCGDHQKKKFFINNSVGVSRSQVLFQSVLKLYVPLGEGEFQCRQIFPETSLNKF